MAEFYDGFVYECDVTAPLTIEGNRLDFTGSRKRLVAKLPSGGTIRAKTRAELARKYIRQSGALERRDRVRARHLARLCRGRAAWNEWRRTFPHVRPMLAGIEASQLRGRNLNGYDLSYANLCGARLRGVSLKRANFHQAILAAADLSEAHLEGANFCRTDLYATNFANAWLTGANLQGVQLVRTNLDAAHLRRCNVYGMSAWDLESEPADQHGLTIRYQPPKARRRGVEEEVEVDGLDLAAFMYFTLNNRNISRVIDAAGRKWVLLLGRFTERRSLLDDIADNLKRRRFIPIIFDFPRPRQRDLLETIVLLAGMSAFVIVDLTNPRSTPMELLAIASNQGVPIVPIMKKGTRPIALLAGLRKFRWVLAPRVYPSKRRLLQRLQHEIIRPAMAEAQRLAESKGNGVPVRRIV